MRTFVMGDLHGAQRALVQCLERSAFDPQEDVLIQLGDVADGHDEVFDCVEMLLTIPKLIAIRGNHDEWFREFIETGYHPNAWHCGGVATARSYLDRLGKRQLVFCKGIGYKTALNPSDVPKRHQDFFQRQLPYYLDEKGRCFVHGGFDPEVSIEWQHPNRFYWDRELWLAALDCTGDRLPMRERFDSVFIGHTSTTHEKTDQPMHKANVWNLDTGAGGGGRLTIMDVETKEFWQSDPVGELYEN
ncbi:MAG TPA: metallophosphoesterase [Puia sp.]